ncbi:MAG: DUF3160 domain-containing protein [Deltaproteobacteria bacterium]|nr:DUF3160 domain-containing protein [Deltaproteobacteria bacterium]
MRFLLACLLVALAAACSRKVSPSADVPPARAAEAAPPAEAGPPPDAAEGKGDAGRGVPPAAEPPASLGQAVHGGMGAPSGFEQFYAYEAPAYRAAGAPPPLPLADLPRNPAIDTTLAGLGVDAEALERLRQSGFVVVASNPGFRFDDLGDAFESLDAAPGDLPLYVSVDAALHLYHLAFDGLLMKLETESLSPLLGRLLDALRARAAEASATAGIVGEAALRNLAVLDTARRLLNPSATADDRVRADVEAEVALIDARAGSAPSPVFGIDEDYTQYVPRGHYTRTEALTRYFRAMMWLGRMTFLVRAEDDPEPRGLVSRPLARRFAAQSLLFVQWLREAQVDGTAALHAWSRIYRTTAFFAGFADDLTPIEVAAAAERALGELWSVSALDKPDRLEALRLQIAAQRVPKLQGGVVFEEGEAPAEPPPLAEQLTPADQAILPYVGLRLFGQRYVPDAEAMARLAFPNVTLHRGEGTPFTLVAGAAGPVRGFSRGLDVMTLLGAPTARGHLASMGDDAYDGYDAALAGAAEVFPPAGDVRWHSNLYWAWLDALRETVGPAAPATQAFQTTPAWSDRLLDGALASWATLRHDTILYVKQATAPKGMPVPPAAEPPPAFVDPYPEVFAKLQALTRMTLRALADMRLVEDGGEAAAVLDAFDGLFGRLTAIAVAEVEDRPATADDRAFLASLPGVCGGLLAQVAHLLATGDGRPAVDLRTTLVADVMTNVDANEVLEEASGPLELLVAAVRVPGSSALFLAAGPVLSYFEFRAPIASRLADEAWRAAIESSPPVAAPWTCSYRVPCPPAAADQPLP